jgi:hypothetical protein
MSKRFDTRCGDVDRLRHGHATVPCSNRREPPCPGGSRVICPRIYVSAAPREGASGKLTCIELKHHGEIAHSSTLDISRIQEQEAFAKRPRTIIPSSAFTHRWHGMERRRRSGTIPDRRAFARNFPECRTGAAAQTTGRAPGTKRTKRRNHDGPALRTLSVIRT